MYQLRCTDTSMVTASPQVADVHEVETGQRGTGCQITLAVARHKDHTPTVDADSPSRRRPLIVGGAATATLLLLAALALPALGQTGSGGAQVVAAPEATAPAASAKPGKGPKAQHVPEVAITLHGTVVAATDADGEASFTLTSGGTTYELEAGPSWWWGDKNPLKSSVGKTVTIVGEHAQGSTTVDVESVDGAAIRDPGKPPWAGGWRVVGSKHPGWAQWKVDKAGATAAKGHGRPSWAGPKTPDASEAPGD